MQKVFLLAKIHHARVTHADINYEGSFSIDKDILDVVGILENEQVHVYNVENGQRFSTYAIPAERGSRVMGANGACAHRVNVGDRVIICTYGSLEKSEWKLQPKIVLLDEKNNYVIKSKVDEKELVT